MNKLIKAINLTAALLSLALCTIVAYDYIKMTRASLLKIPSLFSRKQRAETCECEGNECLCDAPIPDYDTLDDSTF